MATAQEASTQCSCGLESCTIRVTLDNENLWRQCHAIGNEMTTADTGRTMFPPVIVSVRNLDTETPYCVFLEIWQCDRNIYRYVNEEWTARCTSPRDPHTLLYMHPSSIAPGKVWMQSSISFEEIKLTRNSTGPSTEYMQVRPAYKYMAKIKIVQCNDLEKDSSCHNFNFPLTAFIAVLKYRNKNLSELKKRENPRIRQYFSMMNKRVTSDEKDIKDECSNEDSAEPACIKQNPQLPARNQAKPIVEDSNLFHRPRCSESNIAWSSPPTSDSFGDQDPRRSFRSYTSDPSSLSSEYTSPLSCISRNNYSRASGNVPTPGPYLNPGSSLGTSPSGTSSSFHPFQSAYGPPNALQLLPVFPSPYEVQTGIGGQTSQVPPSPPSPWLSRDDRSGESSDEDSYIDVEN